MHAAIAQFALNHIAPPSWRASPHSPAAPRNRQREARRSATWRSPPHHLPHYLTPPCGLFCCATARSATTLRGGAGNADAWMPLSASLNGCNNRTCMYQDMAPTAPSAIKHILDTGHTIRDRPNCGTGQNLQKCLLLRIYGLHLPPVHTLVYAARRAALTAYLCRCLSSRAYSPPHAPPAIHHLPTTRATAISSRLTQHQTRRDITCRRRCRWLDVAVLLRYHYDRAALPPSDTPRHARLSSLITTITASLPATAHSACAYTALTASSAPPPLRAYYTAHLVC